MTYHNVKKTNKMGSVPESIVMICISPYTLYCNKVYNDSHYDISAIKTRTYGRNYRLKLH